MEVADLASRSAGGAIIHRAYSVLNVKAVEDEKRVIRGIATTPETDRVGDIVEPLGVQFKNPMPLLLYHQHDKPVGQVRFSKPTKAGIEFEAKLPALQDPGTLKDRVDEAWQSVKAGLIAGVSIGFRALEFSRLDDGGIRFIETEVLELSLVTVPANAGATITEIRSIDTAQRAASGLGLGGTGQRLPPGVPGDQSKPKTGRVQTMTNTIAEQISAFEATRQAKAARMTEMMNKAAEDGATLDAEQTEEYDGLEAEVKAIDAHLKRLDVLEIQNKAAAKPVTGAASPERASDVRAGVPVITTRQNLPKGTAFTRYAMALMASKGNVTAAEAFSRKWRDSTPEVETVIKAAVDAGTTTDLAWAGYLSEYQTMASEFIDLLYPQTIIGRIPGLNRVPFNIKVPSLTQGATVNWVGQGAPKPVSELAFGQVTLGIAKAAGIVVLSEELVRLSNPSAEAVVRRALVNSMAEFLDTQFVDPNVAEVANVSPASITNGITPVTASGTDSDALKTDIIGLFDSFIDANLNPRDAVWIMPAKVALRIQMMQNALGQAEFPGITVMGGTLLGLPVIVSQSVPLNANTAGGSPAGGSRIILVNASEIFLADDGQVVLDVSREASIQMDSAPSAGAQSLVSLWQNNLVGVKAERFINWKRARDAAVAYIDASNYTPVTA